MKFKTFSEWIKFKEMCGTAVVMGNASVPKNVDFQVWGTPGLPMKHKKKKKKKHESK